MPTKRIRTRRPRRDPRVPEWAARLLEGEVPVYDTEEHWAYVGWWYFDDEVSGLPPGGSPEAYELVQGAREPEHADD